MGPLSDLSWAILQPSGIILSFLFLSFVLLFFGAQRFVRRLLGLSLILLAMPALLPIEELLARPLENRLSAPSPLPQRVDGIIILGGAVNWPVSQSRQILSLNTAAERMIAAQALARRYPDARLVFTGLFREIIPHDITSTPSEQSLLFGPEFANRQITYIGAARSTYEEALLALQVLQPGAGETWLLVTSAYHMPRAYLTFQQQGWTLIPYPVDYRSSGQLALRPSLSILGKLVDLDDIAREWGALFVYQRLGRTPALLP